MSREKITKTIIKGLKRVTRDILQYKPDSEPELKKLEFTVESDDIIDELDFDLVVSSNSNLRDNIFENFSGNRLQLFINDELKSCYIRHESCERNIKTIIVDEIIESEYQEYQFDRIKEKYNKDYKEYFNKLIEQYKDNKGKIALINMYLQSMSKEEVVSLLKNDVKNHCHKQEVVLPISKTNDFYREYKRIWINSENYSSLSKDAF